MTTICVPSEEEAQLVGRRDGLEVLVWDGEGEPPAGVERIEFLVPNYPASKISDDALGRMGALRVVQLLSAGVEPWLGRVPAGAVLCSGRGVHGASTAELAVAGAVSLLRRLPEFAAHQAEHQWVKHRTDDFDGRRVLILGAGDIGTRVATALGAFGAEVTLVGRTARAGVAAIDELPGLLPDAQVVVLALPATPETHRLVDAKFLAALPDQAILVNVARGTVVDTAALLTELTARRLHAFLDVTDPEPLPSDHPLWSAPNLIITPHVGGGTLDWMRRGYRLVREQLQRYEAGEPLQNVVADGF
jgi:phosphoglycerate dehydrogenase-like enzyme